MIVCSKDYPWAQIIVITSLSVVQLMFLLVAKPYQEPNMTRLEIYNEILVLLNSYFLYFFCQALILKPNPSYPKPYNNHIDWDQDSAIYIPDFDWHYDCGWGNIATLALFVLVNLAVLIINAIWTIYKKIKTKYLKKVFNKKMEEL